MKKSINGEKKTPISISLSESILRRLENFCKENYKAERSAVIEEALKKFLGEKGK